MADDGKNWRRLAGAALGFVIGGPWGAVLGAGASALSDADEAEPTPPSEALRRAAAVLGVAPDAPRERVKRRYREALQAHHPDRHAANGAAPESIRRANAESAALIAAYETFCRERGWN